MKNFLKTMGMTLFLLSSLSTSVMAKKETQIDIVNGAQVWADTCMRCHNLRKPESLSKRAWKYSMNHMRVRAGLTGQETRDVLAFILSTKTTKDQK